MGDPAGIGSEIIALSLEKEDLRQRCIVVGDVDRLRAGARKAGSPVKYRRIKSPAEAGKYDGKVPVVDLKVVPKNLAFGVLSKDGGEAAFASLIKAIDLSMAAEVAAIVTAPINKESLHLAGHLYPGHTEILAERTGAPDYVMMLAAGSMRVLHVTTHIRMSQVPESITTERILRVLELGQKALRDMGVDEPKFGVAGLNPHAGEGGIFGDEEELIIAPAIEKAKKMGIDAIGPVPPDIVFLRMNRGHYDAVIAMYHDQGHIPLKLLAFESGVNVTLGLPIIRTSVDHGTAFDIAGKGLADPGSMVEAIGLAISMTGE
jgi:4-hydroxythreonine-4-phosphate dehydrogenase